MIREQLLAGLSWEKNDFLDPTAGEVRLSVDGDEVKISWQEQGLTGNRSGAFMVPARSLLRALQAAIADAEADRSPTISRYSQETWEQLARGWSDADVREIAEQRRFCKPWTADLDRVLVALWLDNDGIKGAHDVFDYRDPLQVRSRLERLGCDPDRPGYVQEGVEIDYELSAPPPTIDLGPDSDNGEDPDTADHGQ